MQHKPLEAQLRALEKAHTRTLSLFLVFVVLHLPPPPQAGSKWR